MHSYFTQSLLTYPNDLPEESHNQMRFPSTEVIRANVDNIATNCCCRVQDQSLVFKY